MLFVLSGVLRLVSVVVFLPHLSEPGAKSVAETLRFITANLYQAASNLVTAPVRHVARLRLGQGEPQPEL